MPTFKDITDDRVLCDQYWEAGLLWYTFPIDDEDGQFYRWEPDVFSVPHGYEEYERPSNKRYHRIKYAILLED